MEIGLGSDREVPDRPAINGQGEIQQVVGEVAGPKIDHLSGCAGRDVVTQGIVQRAEVEEAAPGEWEDPLQKARRGLTRPRQPLLARLGRRGLSLGIKKRAGKAYHR